MFLSLGDPAIALAIGILLAFNAGATGVKMPLPNYYRMVPKKPVAFWLSLARAGHSARVPGGY
jgi:hypothetical protein